MKEGAPSATAEMVCSWRALEATLPPCERILDDPFARGFLGTARRRLVDGISALPAAARRSLLRRLDQLLQGAVTFVLARHRAIDDIILSTPSSQVVFLGAGYDSRRARLYERLCRSRVFEVDHPDTAHRKSRLIHKVYADARLAPTIPVAIDFAHESIEQRLCDAGLNRDTGTIWIWEGVSMYLPEQAVRETLVMFSRLSGPGSLAVFDVLSDPRRAGLLADAQAQALDLAMEWIYSEPFHWHCPQERIEEFSASCGMNVLEDLGLDELVGRYGKRTKGWLEAAPSLRLIVSEPAVL